MKRDFAILVLLLLSVLAASCIREDQSGCESELTLSFRLKEQPDESFRESVHNVDVFLFDTGKHLFTRQRIDRVALGEFAGATFRVPAGRYYVFCWANAGEHTHISAAAGSDLENSYAEIASTATGDPVYYACSTAPGVDSRGAAGDDDGTRAVEVPSGRKTIREMIFAKAHRTVRVYIEGYEHTTLYDGKNPVVKQTGAGGKYDFLLRPDPASVTLEQSAFREETPEGRMHRAVFHSARIPVRSDMEVSVCHPATGEVLARVNLEQYLKENRITDDSVIPILFTFTMDLSVTVALPAWHDNPVEEDELFLEPKER